MLVRNFFLRISRRLVKNLEMDPIPSKVKVNKAKKNVTNDELNIMSKGKIVTAFCLQKKFQYFRVNYR